MNKRTKTGDLKEFLFSGLICILMFGSCKSNESNSEGNAIVNGKISNAISCTSNGLTVTDSTIYMQGGGNEFVETEVDQQPTPRFLPADMVWIPGGEFSMGGVNPVGITDGGKESMLDARPIHRVHVNGFFMDATEVTNRQFAAF